MPIIPLTVTIGLCLVFTFVVFFLREHARAQVSSTERDSLLPLAEETPRLAHVPANREPVATGCACSGGVQAPCAGCLPRTN